MKYYKLTDKQNQTYDKTQWGEGITHTVSGKGNVMCSPDCLHIYDHPLKAVMFNPIHADFSEYNLWECEVSDIVADDTLKIGVKSCTTIRKIKAPEITVAQKVRFAIFCALAVYKETKYLQWAEDWLSGKDRSEAAAAAAAAAGTAGYAARAAGYTARAAAEAAAAAARAAGTAARAAARAAGTAARAAARAAEAAAEEKIDFVALIEKAIKAEPSPK